MSRTIGDHALIGDCHSAALVASDGSITWATFPRFDSPATFSAILDEERGGGFFIAPEGVESVERSYIDKTNILRTTFRSASGVLEVTDCMPLSGSPSPHEVRATHSILRRFACTEGEAEMKFAIEPRFDYGSFVPLFRITSEETAEAVGGPSALHIAATRLLDEERDGIKGRWHLREGDVEWIEVTWSPSYGPAVDVRTSREEFEEALESTTGFWRSWTQASTFPGVERSALVLKALTYAPTGAVVAAPTTSLPEEIGGERNWDYRYTWIRDATLTLISLFALGFREEAEAFKFFLERTSAGRPEDLQIMYGVGGERFLPELTLDHLSGHLGSAPVRIGNGAAKQRQLDVYGQIVESAYLFGKAGGRITPDNWNYIVGLVDIVADTWRDPDQGIWEIRDEPRHFVHSKVNCWAALDRAVKIAEARKVPAPIEKWSHERDELASYLLDDATRRGWFAQAVGADEVDASVLLVPALGFLPASHPLVQRTVDVIRSELGSTDALLLRYKAPDGLEGGEGSFLLCSFWLADVLTYAGRTDEAQRVLDELASYANDVGLWAEETDPRTGEPRGNFPQAFTHMAHITSTLHLEAAKRGEIDHDRAYDFSEAAVDRLLAAGHLAHAAASPSG